MSLTEQERHKLHKDLEQAIGSESAGNLMSHLPSIGWADLATRRDLDTLRIELRGEFAELRGEVRGEIGELRGELGELGGEIHQAMNAQTKALFVSLTSVMLTLTALGFAALQLT